MKAVLIDDEVNGRENLKQILASFAPEVVVLGEADSVKEGSFQILKHKPDLVFLDIEMPTGNGFQLFDLFPEPEFAVIFTTAYDHYAIKAIRFSALDYLLKPIDPDDLLLAIEKAKETVSTRKLNYEVLVSNLSQQNPKNLILSDQNKSVVLAISSVIYLAAQGGYCTIFYEPSESILTSRSIGHYESMLPLSDFFRCHKSYLINLQRVKQVNKSGELIMSNGDSIEVSRRKKDELMNRLESL